MFSLFKKKRKQCKKCKKTFYETTDIIHLAGGYVPIRFEVSPCCQGDYIIV
jgi:hypothetical protein